MKKFFAFLVVSLVFIGAGAAFAGSVMDKDVIRVGTEATYPPFEYRNKDNQVVGYDIDIATLIGEKIGKKVEIVDMAFDGLIPALMTGKIDMVAAGMTNTAERKKKVNFSNVYYDIENAFVVRADDDSIKSIEDLDGKIATVQIGTAQDTFVTKLGTAKEVKRFQKNDDALREVLLGRGDFTVLNLTVANSFLRESEAFKGKLKIGFRNFINKPGEGIALGLPKEDEAFLNAVNGALAEMEKSGELHELKVKYQID